MKRFRFRLEKVLSWRGREEARARRSLALATSELALAQQAVERAESVEKDLQQEGADLVLSGRAGALPLQEALVARVRAAGVESCRRALELEGERESALAAWRKAQAARRSLERFRERAWERHQLEARRQETREMDEIGRAGFIAAMGERP